MLNFASKMSDTSGKQSSNDQIVIYFTSFPTCAAFHLDENLFT